MVHDAIAAYSLVIDDLYLFASEEGLTLARKRASILLDSKRSIPFKVISFKCRRAMDTSIDKELQVIDNVSPILESLLHISSVGNYHSPTLLISLASSKDSQLTSIAGLEELFNSFTPPKGQSPDILLLGKVFRLTSLSDWHDLQVVGLRISNEGVRQWVQILNDTFSEYSNRRYFGMIEPRPAILEANKQLRNLLRVHKVRSRYVCAYGVEDTYSCEYSVAAVKIKCSAIHEGLDRTPCLQIDIPNEWKRRVNLKISLSLEETLGSEGSFVIKFIFIQILCSQKNRLGGHASQHRKGHSAIF